MGPTFKAHLKIYIAVTFMLSLAGCGGNTALTPASKPYVSAKILSSVRFTVQVGAFSNIDNALRLTDTLQHQGLNAYHFVHKSGLYKVRFGNFPSKDSAHKKAESLKTRGIIDEFYIVSPQYQYGESQLRISIVKTAKSFIGVPYRWGGSSYKKGFDCSGLTMAVYRLNGLNLPRSSREQWKTGKPVKRRQLLKGDLVFFATSGGRKISHVGIYTGNNKFIHASGSGREIRTASLLSKYYKTRYVGARTYI